MTNLILSPPATPMFNEVKDTPENLAWFVQTFVASTFPPSKKQLQTSLYTPPASPMSPHYSHGPHSELYDFAYYIITRAELCTEAALCALALLARLRRKLPRARAESGPRLFLAAMIVASKGLFDIAYNNPGWYEIAAGCPAIEADFALADINLMERQLLSHLDYRVAVFGDEILALRRIYMTGHIQQTLVKSQSTNTSISNIITPPPSPLDIPVVEQASHTAQAPQHSNEPVPPPRPSKSRVRNSIGGTQDIQHYQTFAEPLSIYARRPRAAPLPPLLPVQSSTCSMETGPLSAPMSNQLPQYPQAFENSVRSHRRWF